MSKFNVGFDAFTVEASVESYLSLCRGSGGNAECISCCISKKRDDNEKV
jgi:hypothetical protein